MLSRFAEWVVTDLLGLPSDGTAAGILVFFLYDTIKILFLLWGMVFVMGVLRTFLPRQRIRTWVRGRGVAGYMFAALFGAVTPFCSCSSIPIFFGMLEAGIPLGPMLSFLITSPIVNEYLVVLMLGFFGWKIAVLYVLSGLIIGVVGGWALGRWRLESYLERDLTARRACLDESEEDRFWTPRERLRFGRSEACSVLRKVGGWVVGGVAVGALIHNFVPEEVLQGIVGRMGIFSVPVATLVGVPLYGSCAAIVPIAVVLFQKGVPLGTALAFMMAVAALSLPEAVMLRRAMRLPLIGIFFSLTALAIMITGYIFNALQALIV